jgi:hypothetical protein
MGKLKRMQVLDHMYGRNCHIKVLHQLSLYFMYQNTHSQVSIVHSIVLGGNTMLSKFTRHIKKAQIDFQ